MMSGVVHRHEGEQCVLAVDDLQLPVVTRGRFQDDPCRRDDPGGEEAAFAREVAPGTGGYVDPLHQDATPPLPQPLDADARHITESRIREHLIDGVGCIIDEAIGAPVETQSATAAIARAHGDPGVTEPDPRTPQAVSAPVHPIEQRAGLIARERQVERIRAEGMVCGEVVRAGGHRHPFADRPIMSARSCSVIGHLSKSWAL